MLKKNGFELNASLLSHSTTKRLGSKLLHGLDSLDHLLFLRGTNSIIAIVDVAQGATKNGRLNRPDAPGAIFVKHGASADCHFHFGSFH